MVTNILQNAINYTPEHGKINLRLKEVGDCIEIELTDTGLGIPKNEQSRIFDEFYRASNVRKQFANGTGIGLSLVKQIVERHDGKIRVESEEGKGSSFIISLPRAHHPEN